MDRTLEEGKNFSKRGKSHISRDLTSKRSNCVRNSLSLSFFESSVLDVHFGAVDQIFNALELFCRVDRHIKFRTFDRAGSK